MSHTRWYVTSVDIKMIPCELFCRNSSSWIRGQLHLPCCENTTLWGSDFSQSCIIIFWLICPELSSSSKHGAPHYFKLSWASSWRTSPIGHLFQNHSAFSLFFFQLSIFIQSPVVTCCITSALLSLATLTSQSCVEDIDWWHFHWFPPHHSWQAKLCQMSGTLSTTPKDYICSALLTDDCFCCCISTGHCMLCFDHRPQLPVALIIWLVVHWKIVQSSH